MKIANTAESVDTFTGYQHYSLVKRNRIAVALKLLSMIVRVPAIKRLANMPKRYGSGYVGFSTEVGGR